MIHKGFRDPKSRRETELVLARNLKQAHVTLGHDLQEKAVRNLISGEPLKARGRALLNLARFYVREGMSDVMRWHTKLGHIAPSSLQKIVPGLKIPRDPLRCDACLRGKAHHLGSVKDGSGFRRSYKPGESIHTDHQGPWLRSREGKEKSRKQKLDEEQKKTKEIRKRKPR